MNTGSVVFLTVAATARFG